MVPFYIAATLIVVAVGTFAALFSRPGTPLDVHSQSGAALPPRPQTEATSTASNPPFSGEAPWAFAALPGCFEQTERVDGPVGFVHARVPKKLRQLRDGETVTAGDCIIRVTSAGTTIQRGADRFTVPPLVRVYLDQTELLTYRERGGLAELRTYRVVK